MSGKITFLHGRHPSRMAGWSPVVALNDRLWSKLNGAIGRALTAAEIDTVRSGLGGLRGLHQAGADISVSRQDIIATLAKLATLDDDAARVAVDNMDSISCAAIDLFLARGSRPQDSAAAALEQMRAEIVQGGRRMKKGYQQPVALLAVTLWRDFGMTDMRAVQVCDVEGRGYEPSPLAEWTQALVDAAGGQISASASQAIKLLREIPGVTH